MAESETSTWWCQQCKVYRPCSVREKTGILSCNSCDSQDLLTYSPDEAESVEKVRAIDTKAADDSLSREAIQQVLNEPNLGGVVVLYFDEQGRPGMATGGCTNSHKAYLLYYMQMNLMRVMAP